MYDVTNRSTFLNVPEWISNTRDYSSGNTRIILVGNKVDRTDRDVTTEDGEKLAKLHKLKFLETSAKTGQNCEQVYLSEIM